MTFQSFCGVATLQVGVSLLATVFILVATVVFAANVFNYYVDPTIGWPAPLVIVLVFVVVMVLAGLVMFLAAYKESRPKALAALALILFLTLCWIMLSIVSFANNPTHLKMVCNHLKCPESLWLAELSYRDWRNDFSHCKIPKRVEIKQVTMSKPPKPNPTEQMVVTSNKPVPGTPKTSKMPVPGAATRSTTSLVPITTKTSPILIPENTTTSTPTLAPETMSTTSVVLQNTTTSLAPETTPTSTTTTQQHVMTIPTTSETTIVTEAPSEPALAPETTPTTTQQLVTTIPTTSETTIVTEAPSEPALASETTLTSTITTQQLVTTIQTTSETTIVTEAPSEPASETTLTSTTSQQLVTTITTTSKATTPPTEEEVPTTTEANDAPIDIGGNTGAKRKRSDLNTREMGSEFKTTSMVMTDALFRALPMTRVDNKYPRSVGQNENTRSLRMLSTESKEETASYVYGLPFAGAVILFVINLLFLLFSAFILWSYAKELQWVYQHEVKY